MSEPKDAFSSMLKEAADALRSDWQKLVAVGIKLARDKDSVEQVARALSLAGKSSQDSIKRKLLGIHHMQDLGYTEEEIAEMGQTVVLSEFQKTKKAEAYEKQTSLIFKIPGSQREIVQTELERVKTVLNIQTSEALWDFLLAQLKQCSDDELRHAAGGAHAKG